MRNFFFSCSAFLLSTESLHAYPSSLFWTNCSTEVCETDRGFLEMGKYVKVINRHGKGKAIPADYGITYGFGQYEHISFEAGLDILAGKNPIPYLNAKMGLPEGVISAECPSFSLGISDVGIKTHGHVPTNQNIVCLTGGKTVSWSLVDTIYVGGFKGNRPMGKNRVGAMFGLSKNVCPRKTTDGKEFYRIALLVDYATGKNSIGGGGFGISYYFAPDIFLQTGPIWFSDRKVNGRWKWMFLLHVNVP